MQMKKNSLVCAIVIGAALLSAAGVVRAVPAPVQVFVDGVSAGSVNWSVDPNTSGGFITQQIVFGDRSVDPWEVRLGSASFSPDPILTYGVGFTILDNNPHTLKLVYDAPFSPPIGTPLDGLSSLFATIVDGGTNGVSVTAAASGTVQTVTLLPGSGNNVGLSLGGSFVGAASGSTGSIFGYSPADVSVLIPAPGTPWTGLHVVAEFGFSPSGDSIGLDGIVRVKEVPEPSVYAMLFAGLIMIGWVARRSVAR